MTPAAKAQSSAHRARHMAIYNTARDASRALGRTHGVAPNAAAPAIEDYPTFPEGLPSYHGGNAN
jgi:hypothetical protein